MGLTDTSVHDAALFKLGASAELAREGDALVPKVWVRKTTFTVGREEAGAHFAASQRLEKVKMARINRVFEAKLVLQQEGNGSRKGNVRKVQRAQDCAAA